jgi:hypothetical protein
LQPRVRNPPQLPSKYRPEIEAGPNLSPILLLFNPCARINQSDPRISNFYIKPAA